MPHRMTSEWKMILAGGFGLGFGAAVTFGLLQDNVGWFVAHTGYASAISAPRPDVGDRVLHCSGDQDQMVCVDPTPDGSLTTPLLPFVPFLELLRQSIDRRWMVCPSTGCVDQRIVAPDGTAEIWT